VGRIRKGVAEEVETLSVLVQKGAQSRENSLFLFPILKRNEIEGKILDLL